jgi:predicted GNAT family N-acyltransferase
MDIKKIIKEEIGDFDWTSDIRAIPKEPTEGFEFTLERENPPVVYRIDNVMDDIGTFYVSWDSLEADERHRVDMYHTDYYDWYEKNEINPISYMTESNDIRVINTPDTVSVYKDGGVCDISHMGNGIWEVNRVFTKKGTRGGGLGSELLSTALNKVLEKNPSSIYVTPYGYGSDPEELYVFYGKNGFVMDDEQYGLMWYQKENLNEDFESDWDWTERALPMEDQNPEEWVGRTFGYGKKLMDTLSVIERDEVFTIDGIDEHGNLLLTKNHPIYGQTSDIGVTPRTLRDSISNGDWVWV